MQTLINENDLVVESFPIGSFACNCTVFYSDSTRDAVIIDPGNDEQMLNEYIKDRGLKVHKLIHTHAHFDHIGASAQIKVHTGADLYLHRGDEFLYNALAEQGMFFGQSIPAPGPWDKDIEDEQEFEIPGQSTILQALHTPGHTPGSCCFYTEVFGKPLLLSGDTLFAGSIGRTDLPGGDGNLIIKSIKSRLLTLTDQAIVVPGHGPNTVLHQEKRHNPFLS